MISTNEKEVPILYECYPDAFRTIYQDKRCSVYEVSDKDFQKGVTSWSPELVCSGEVSRLWICMKDCLQKKSREIC